MSVIVILADGVRVDTLSNALDSGAFPALGRLRADGGLHSVTSAFPSVTGPAYTPFLMGRFPGSVGLPGLRWYDRARAACTFPDYTRSYVGYQMRAMDRDLDPAALTIFELVPDSVAALSVITRGLSRRRQLASLTASFLQTWSKAVPADSAASASRSLRTICSGLCLLRLIESLLAPAGAVDSHNAWISFRGAGQMMYAGQSPIP